MGEISPNLVTLDEIKGKKFPFGEHCDQIRQNFAT